ncbi:membrane-associated phosphatidylinositol transfer protein 2 [Nematolebias whitei]|uniref:membrane-associated phosphatidylinositol transfer protein 2 n=1 Tax=Nematolebias whitei TaxID=451745 RepID=UPI00189B5BCE|nr:membrane-associated phosphatidylinositol transfer protein 2 [Nematolebias whitei]
MLIKEYRIPMPMSVEEYRIAQLYMIQKKSREESCGEGNGVEILENKPYEDGPGGSGQYTHKVYHIGKHIPSWFCAILPQAALRVEEESWNAYPYTRTRYTCPFVEKFSIDIETYYKPDTGCQADVFNLSSAERRQRTVDPIDIVKDYIPPHEYLVEEDPKLYQSVKTKRGPLSEDWIEDMNQNPGQSIVMCAYKLCKVEFRYWGMQSKIERFIHDVGLRKVMVRAHRQAWCWQDEWYGLTMEDIRELELETQLALAKKMAQYSQSEEGAVETNSSSVNQDQDQEVEIPGSAAEAEGADGKLGESLESRGELTKQWSTSSRSSNRSSKRGMSPSHQCISEWRMQSIARDSDDSTDDEFFDAHEEFSDNEDMLSKKITKWSSNDLMDKIETIEVDEARGSRDTELLSPSIAISSISPSSPSLEDSRHLSRSNIDIPRCSGPDDPKKQLPRKRSDLSTYELDTIKHHQAFLSSLHSSVLHGDPGSRRSSNSTMLEGGSLGKFDFEVTDFFMFGSPLGLVLALRKTVVPSLDVSVLRPACQQVYNLFHPADPSASRLEPLLEKRFHVLPPFSVPRYQRFPLGDGHSALLVDTVQNNPQVLKESSSNAAHYWQESSGNETTISVPIINSHTSQVHTEAETPQSHMVDAQCPTSTSPGVHHLRCHRRASEASITSQASGLADSFTATNIATTNKCDVSHNKRPRLLSQLPLPYCRFTCRSPSIRSCSRTHRVFPRPDGVESEHSSDISSDVTSDLTNVTFDITDISLVPQSSVLKNRKQVASHWWGSKRMDYALYCPDALTAFPTVALPHLFHASYWESTDVVSFLLRQVMRHENSGILELDGKEVSEFTPSIPREKWLRKRTHVKIRNVTANHRANDAVFTEDGVQTVTGRFMYGPLDMVTLTGEKIDIHIMTQPPSGEWVYFHTELTNSSGRVSYVIPESKRLGIGVYPVKMVVRGDHTYADSHLTVVPKGTEFVVFSIDGSFAASVSIMGSDPKVRAGAVDVVRFWQDLGYLIVYVTGRPDMQKQRVVAWLSQHNFPHGVVSFCDGLVHDPLRHKTNFLKTLISEAHMRIFAAYGSNKDISVYTSVGLPPSQIYIVGRLTKKLQHQCQFIPDGYVSHLSQLDYNQRSRPAKSTSTCVVLRKGSLALGAAGGDFLRKHNHIFRTVSSQQPGGVGTASPAQLVRTERTLSQCEGERERSVASATQRSMSLAAGCWGRSGSTKEGSGGLLGPKGSSQQN